MKRIRARTNQELKYTQCFNGFENDPAQTYQTPSKLKPDEIRKAASISTNGEKSISPPKNCPIIGPILYNAEELLPELDPHIYSYIQINVFAQHLTTESNQTVLTQSHGATKVKSNELWGARPYTSDSDVVCMICHSGIYKLMKEAPKFYLLKVILYILPGATSYESCERYGIKSRTWGPHEVSLLPVKVEIIDVPDPVIQLHLERKHLRRIEKSITKYVSRSSPATNNYATTRESKGKTFHERSPTEQLEHMTPNILPKTTTFLFSLSNEPCFQYHRGLIFDRGVNPSQWTSYRLKNSVLVLESSVRYELSREPPTDPLSHTCDTYRWSEVLSPAEKTREWYSKNDVPLNKQHVRVLASGLDWSQIVWTEHSVRIDHTNYNIKKLFWIDTHQTQKN